MAPLNGCAKFHLIWAAIGVFAGLSAGPIWALRYYNFLASFLAFFSAICAAHLFYTHWAFHSGRMRRWGSGRIEAAFIITLVISVLAAVGTVEALFMAHMHRQTVSGRGLLGTNLWMAAVWFWMSFKWSLSACIFTRKYGKQVAICKRNANSTDVL